MTIRRRLHRLTTQARAAEAAAAAPLHGRIWIRALGQSDQWTCSDYPGQVFTEATIPHPPGGPIVLLPGQAR